MTWLPIITCPADGGLYIPKRDASAPIRIYQDRTVYDDFVGGFRERLSRSEFRRVRMWSQINVLNIGKSKKRARELERLSALYRYS